MWMAVSADQYELPYAVAESARELAGMLKTSIQNIYKKKSLRTSGKICGYRVLTVDDEEDMKYDILESFRAYLDMKMTKNTAKKYYSAVKNLLKDVSFQALEEIDPEYIREQMKKLPSKNEFSATKMGLLKLHEYDPSLRLPEEGFFKAQSKRKKNHVKSRGQKIYKDTIVRKINQIRDPDLRLAYRLEMVSGLRISELASLRPEDVKLDRDILQVFVRDGKGGKSGMVECLDDAYVRERMEKLLRYADHGVPLFYAAGHMMNEAWRLGFECHDLRRIYAQDLELQQLRQGKSRQEAGEAVRRALRHSNVKTTQIYLRGRQVIRGHPGKKSSEERGRT